jgi:hypothetical protein
MEAHGEKFKVPTVPKPLRRTGSAEKRRRLEDKTNTNNMNVCLSGAWPERALFIVFLAFHKI